MVIKNFSNAATPTPANTPAPDRKNSNNDDRKGAFESCFAVGLDLSEFSASKASPSSPNHAIKSASAELLKTTLIEKEQKEADEQMELKMNAMVRDRALDLEKSLRKKKEEAASGNTILSNALINMHQSDTISTSNASRKLMKKKNRSASRQRAGARGGSVGSSSKATKKSQRTKY